MRLKFASLVVAIMGIIPGLAGAQGIGLPTAGYAAGGSGLTSFYIIGFELGPWQEYLAQAPGHDDPTGVRVTWNNLPLAHNTIHIFTESGDLVDTLQHDGFNQGGSISWNLVSRNGQEIISGIYLYVVKSDNSDFADFQGRFIVIN